MEGKSKVNIVGEGSCKLLVRRARVGGAPLFFIPTVAAISEATWTRPYESFRAVLILGVGE